MTSQNPTEPEQLSSSPHLSSSNQIFVGGMRSIRNNFTKEAFQEMLYQEFQIFGEIVWVGESAPPLGYVFVEYMSEESVVEAVRCMNGEVRFGCILKVERKRQEKRVLPKPRISISPLHAGVSRQDLHKVFRKFGSISNIWMSSYFPIYSYIEFYELTSARQAMERTNGLTLFGRQVKVDLIEHSRNELRDKEKRRKMRAMSRIISQRYLPVSTLPIKHRDRPPNSASDPHYSRRVSGLQYDHQPQPRDAHIRSSYPNVNNSNNHHCPDVSGPRRLEDPYAPYLEDPYAPYLEDPHYLDHESHPPTLLRPASGPRKALGRN